MFHSIFEVIYLAGFICGILIRGWYGRKYPQDRRAVYRKEGLFTGLLASLTGIGMALPLFSMFTTWFAFANYNAPVWPGWIGTVTLVAAVFLLWKSYADLGYNWSVTSEIKQGQTLVTHGVYRFARHPMYGGYLLWGVSQALLIHNWLTGLAHLAVFMLLYVVRVPREEKMMLEHFGEAYSRYMSQTGRIIPRFRTCYRQQPQK